MSGMHSSRLSPMATPNRLRRCLGAFWGLEVLAGFGVLVFFEFWVQGLESESLGFWVQKFEGCGLFRCLA